MVKRHGTINDENSLGTQYCVLCFCRASTRTNNSLNVSSVPARGDEALHLLLLPELKNGYQVLNDKDGDNASCTERMRIVDPAVGKFLRC